MAGVVLCAGVLPCDDVDQAFVVVATRRQSELQIAQVGVAVEGQRTGKQRREVEVGTYFVLD